MGGKVSGSEVMSANMGSFDCVRLAPHFAQDDSVSHDLGMTAYLPQCPITLHIIKQRHKSKIHVQLLVTMKQRQPRIIRHKIHFRRLVAAQHHHVFHHARH
jgi:hypothetical protein